LIRDQTILRTTDVGYRKNTIKIQEPYLSESLGEEYHVFLW